MGIFLSIGCNNPCSFLLEFLIPFIRNCSRRYANRDIVATCSPGRTAIVIDYKTWKVGFALISHHFGIWLISTSF